MAAALGNRSVRVASTSSQLGRDLGWVPRAKIDGTRRRRTRCGPWGSWPAGWGRSGPHARIRHEVHKIRNVEAKLSKAMGATRGPQDAGRLPRSRPTRAEATLEALARSLEQAHPGAAGSLREGLAETLTISRLGVPATLARTLRSTNAIESMMRSAGTRRSSQAVPPGQRTTPPPRRTPRPRSPRCRHCHTPMP